MPLKQVIVIRKDLKLSKGKLAAQVAHGSIGAAEKSKLKDKWLKEGQKKVVLSCKNLEELHKIYKMAKNKKLPAVLIKDAGLTQIEEGTETCVGIGPAPEEKIDEITGKLKLL